MDRKYSNMASELSGRGRYGDSMLMHVNPIEVEALNSAVPGGLTRNPDTGMPEAFAWAPLLIPMLMGGAAGGVTAKQNDQPIWKGILLGATISGATAGIGAAATAPAAAAAPVAPGLSVAPELLAAGASAPAAYSPALGPVLPELLPQVAPLLSGAAPYAGPVLPAAANVGGMSSNLSALEGLEGLKELGVNQSTPLPGQDLAPLTGQELAVNELGFTPKSLDPIQSIGSPNPAPPVELSPVEPLGPVTEPTAGTGVEESFKDRFIEQLKNPVDAEGKAMEYGLGEYMDEPWHGMASVAGTDMLLPYEEEEEYYPSSGREGVWASGYGDYDSGVGPSWGRYS